MRLHLIEVKANRRMRCIVWRRIAFECPERHSWWCSRLCTSANCTYVRFSVETATAATADSDGTCHRLQQFFSGSIPSGLIGLNPLTPNRFLNPSKPTKPKMQPEKDCNLIVRQLSGFRAYSLGLWASGLPRGKPSTLLI